MKRILIIAGIVLGVVLIGTFGYLGFRSGQRPVQEIPTEPDTVAVSKCDVTQTVTAPGSVVNQGETSVRLPLEAMISKVLVRPGDAVYKGDALLELNPTDVALAIAQAQVDLVNAQDAFDSATSKRNAMNYPRATDLTREAAELHYTNAQKQFDEAQWAYNLVANLPETDPSRVMALDALVAAKQQREQALSSLTWYSNHFSQKEINAAQATLALAQAKLELAQATLERLQADFITPDGISNTLKAPFSGVVLEVKVQPGETLGSGAALLTLTDPQAVEVESTVLEEDYPYLTVGQRVDLYFDAVPDASVTGKVDRILPKRASGDRPLYYVYISLDEVPDHLVDGMTADASIVIAERQQVLCLPRALVRASSGSNAAVTVWNGLTTETRQITVGLRGDVYIEILSGLQTGEQVVTR